MRSLMQSLRWAATLRTLKYSIYRSQTRSTRVTGSSVASPLFQPLPCSAEGILRLVIDGKEIAESLMDIVRAPLRRNPSNSVVAFNDNAGTPPQTDTPTRPHTSLGAISGFTVQSLQPMRPGQSCALEAKPVAYDITYTAETHNFPTGIAPFAGAETGTGGRIRDCTPRRRLSLVAYCSILILPTIYVP